MPANRTRKAIKKSCEEDDCRFFSITVSALLNAKDVLLEDHVDYVAGFLRGLAHAGYQRTAHAGDDSDPGESSPEVVKSRLLEARIKLLEVVTSRQNAWRELSIGEDVNGEELAKFACCWS